MNTLNLRQSRRVLDNLLEARRDHLLRLPHGARHIARLQALRAKIDAVHDQALREGADDGLRVLVAQHIEATAALRLGLAHQRANPIGEPSDREAADRLYTAILSERIGAYPSASDRGATADEIRKMLAVRPNLAADLARMPEVVRETLDLCLTLGDQIEATYSARTEPGGPEHLESRSLLQETWRTLARLRRAIRSELEVNPEAPAELESWILGFAQSLVDERRRRRPVPAPAEAEAPSAVIPAAPMMDPAALPPARDRARAA